MPGRSRPSSSTARSRPRSRIIDRTLDVWYGRLRIEDSNGALVSNADLVRLDKPISEGLRTALQADVPGTLPPANGQADFEWVYPGSGNDAGSDARQALVAAFTAAGNAAGPGSLGPPVDGTTSKKDYLLESTGTVEITAPLSDPGSATLVGDTDDHFGPNPVKCPGPDQSDLQLSIDNRWVAEVSFHELNATYTLAAPPPQPAPEQAQPAPQQQGQAQPPQRYAPAATIVGPCGDPRIHVRMDNSLSTLPAEFKIIYKHGARDQRIVKRHTLAPGQVFQTGWLWVRGNGNYVRVRDQYQRLLARVHVRDVPAWGEGDCPATGLQG